MKYKKYIPDKYKIRYNPDGMTDLGIKSIDGGKEFNPMVTENGVRMRSKEFTEVELLGEEITKEEYEE